MSWFFPPLMVVARLLGWVLILSVFLDTLLLYGRRGGLLAGRQVSERFSNGDVNEVLLQIQNNYPFTLNAVVIDELPEQFQDRQWRRTLSIAPGATAEIPYELVPKERGVYTFGQLHVFILSPLGLVRRRCSFGREEVVKVYPSYIHMRKHQFEVMGSTQDAGRQRLRRTGRSLEFEQIKDYVPGDDYRTINWKASARKDQLMVNTYVEERSQPIYCVIDKGRLMKFPFQGMTLLDYAINASLALINVALQRRDKAGLITFSRKIDQFLPAERQPSQLSAVMEALLPYLRAIGRFHLLVTVFFDNTELHSLQRAEAHTIEDIYIKTIADRFLYEKRLIAKELAQVGILSVFTSPENLTVATINKYLEIKARQAI
jgi:uncharacterized protein (DUF58 family)